MFRRDQRGQVVVEYAIVFPVQLMLTLAIIQLALIFVAKHVVNYAAFCGARAEIVGEDPTDAACLPLSAVAGTAGAEAETNIEVPGWGELPRSGAARLKTRVEVASTDEGGVTVVRCDVDHDFQLDIPIGNYIVYGLGEMFVSYGDLTHEDYNDEAPHLPIKGVSYLARPWALSGDVEN